MNTQIKSLYRIYRPKNFNEVVGQEFVTKTLCNQITSDKIGHAYLFCGTRGTGKTSVAKIFANAVNCEKFDNGKVCGKCEWCKNQNKNLDLYEIDAASNNGVDAVRELIDTAKYPPVVGKYKVYIIDEVHMFSGSAFNALLKTLEEPPSHVLFILATTEPHKLLPTVQSRCMKFNFRNVSDKDIASLLKKVFQKESITANDEAIAQIAKEGKGSVRDALSFADTIAAYSKNKEITLNDINNVIGGVDFKLFEKLVDDIEKTDAGSIRKNIDAIFNISSATDRIISNTLSAVKNKYIKAPNSKLASMLKIFAKLEMNIKYSANPKEYFETACMVASTEGL